MALCLRVISGFIPKPRNSTQTRTFHRRHWGSRAHEERLQELWIPLGHVCQPDISWGAAVAILMHEDFSSGKSPDLYPGLGAEGQGMLASIYKLGQALAADL